MQSPVRAIAWEFHARHRVGAVALAAYLILLCAVKLLLLGPGHPVRFNPPNGLAGFVMAPVAMAFFYLVGVFTYGLGGDLAARESIYPARLFTLPVSTRALAGWPMLYGTSAAAGLWIATALFVRLALGTDVELPLIWPALLTAVYVAWMQALAWMPYGMRGVRVTLAVLWLATVDAVVLAAIELGASEATMSAVLAPLIPVAYLAARIAVTRARHGDVPNWSATLARFATGAAIAGRRASHFRTPARAQAWFEWRVHGRALPALVSIVVPAELLLLFIPGNDTAPIVFLTLFVVVLTPPVLAVFVAAAVHPPTPFTRVRPLGSASLVAARLKTSVRSTLAAWLIVVTAIPLALTLSGTLPVVTERVRALIDVAGSGRAAALASVVLFGLIASTWKHLVQSLCISLSGREWLSKSTALAALASVALAAPAAEWVIRSRAAQAAIWSAFPWILASLVCLKLMAAAWVAVRLYGSRLLPDRVLVAGAVGWFATVLAIYGVLEWFAASPLVPRYFLGSIAILQVPLARVAAAPLALAWDRHR